MTDKETPSSTDRMEQLMADPVHKLPPPAGFVDEFERLNYSEPTLRRRLICAMGGHERHIGAWWSEGIPMLCITCRHCSLKEGVTKATDVPGIDLECAQTVSGIRERFDRESG